jgi:hypothetical protein
MTNNRANDSTSGADREHSTDVIGVLFNLLNLFREHPAILVTLLYLQVTTLGVMYSWSLFRRFDINIFDYAETNDFLLAAFKDPTVFVLSVANLCLALVTLMYSMRIVDRDRRKRQNLKRLRISEVGTGNGAGRIIGQLIDLGSFLGILFLVVGFTLFLPFVIADSAADSLLRPKYEPLTTVKYRAAASSKAPIRETGLRVIGTTESFVFFYDRNDTRTLAIPTAQIVAMEHDGPQGEPKENQ